MKRIIYCILFLAAAITAAAQASAVKLKQVAEIKPADAPQYFQASVLPDECRLLRWEPGRLMYAEASSPRGWKKLRDFKPEDLYIRMAEDKAVRLLEPGKLDGFYFDKKNGLAAFIMYLGDSVNGTLAVMDAKQDRVIYSMPVRIHPNVPGRRMEFMAIENLISVPYLSSDGGYAVFNMYNYMYFPKVGVLDLKTKKVTEVDNAISPHPSGGEVFYFHTDKKTGKKSYVRAPLSDPGRFTAVTECDFIVGALVPAGESVYVVSGMKILAIKPGKEAAFTEVADLTGSFAGYSRAGIAKLYAAECRGKMALYALMELVKGDKYSYKAYSIGLPEGK